MFEVPKHFVLTSVLVAFSLVTIVYRYWDVFFKSYGERGKIYFGWTLYLLGFVHSLIGALSLLEYLFLREKYNWLIGTAAFSVFLVGQIVRNWAIVSLGKLHSPHIEIKPGHELIRKPPYRYTRNPYYAGVILEVLSTPLILNAYRTFAFSLLSYVPILLLRMILEEKVMMQHFGSAYADYKNKTPYLIPRLG